MTLLHKSANTFFALDPVRTNSSPEGGSFVSGIREPTILPPPRTDDRPHPTEKNTPPSDLGRVSRIYPRKNLQTIFWAKRQFAARDYICTGR